ncbi:plasmid stabilization system protein [Campylobacter hyointestinalis subsp. hyointestinalis]|nr:plasmid stabilization system protein [Campylobacter hyointestinalis subsp. hyointestinalis]
MPFRFRKSVTSDNDNIRDFIFKGYVMPFLIQDDTIIVLGIYKENQWESQIKQTLRNRLRLVFILA